MTRLSHTGKLALDRAHVSHRELTLDRTRVSHTELTLNRTDKMRRGTRSKSEQCATYKTTMSSCFSGTTLSVNGLHAPTKKDCMNELKLKTIHLLHKPTSPVKNHEAKVQP